MLGWFLDTILILPSLCSIVKKTVPEPGIKDTGEPIDYRVSVNDLNEDGTRGLKSIERGKERISRVEVGSGPPQL